MRPRLLLVWLLASAGCTFNPKAAQQSLMMGDLRLVQQDVSAAIGLYDQAIASDPYLHQAYLHRGVAYRQSNRFDRSLADIDRAIALDPTDTRAYAQRARTCLEFLMTEAKDDRLRVQEALGPKDPLGIMADLDRSVTLDGMAVNGEGLLLRGAIRLVQNRQAEAQNDFDRFLRRRPRARETLESTIEQWKKEKPLLDLKPIDEMVRVQVERGR